MPLPASTGEAIARHVRYGRPQTTDRNLLVRHRAPADIPLSVAAIRNAMNRALARCGLHDQFCNTHVLRRTIATRLQRAEALALRCADVDLTSGVLCIKDAKFYQRRLVPVHPSVTEQLRAYALRRDQLVLGPACERFFLRDDGLPINRSAMLYAL